MALVPNHLLHHALQLIGDDGIEDIDIDSWRVGGDDFGIGRARILICPAIDKAVSCPNVRPALNRWRLAVDRILASIQPRAISCDIR